MYETSGYKIIQLYTLKLLVCMFTFVTSVLSVCMCRLYRSACMCRLYRSACMCRLYRSAADYIGVHRLYRNACMCRLYRSA